MIWKLIFPFFALGIYESQARPQYTATVHHFPKWFDSNFPQALIPFGFDNAQSDKNTQNDMNKEPATKDVFKQLTDTNKDAFRDDVIHLVGLQPVDNAQKQPEKPQIPSNGAQQTSADNSQKQSEKPVSVNAQNQPQNPSPIGNVQQPEQALTPIDSAQKPQISVIVDGAPQVGQETLVNNAQEKQEIVKNTQETLTQPQKQENQGSTLQQQTSINTAPVQQSMQNQPQTQVNNLQQTPIVNLQPVQQMPLAAGIQQPFQQSLVDSGHISLAELQQKPVTLIHSVQQPEQQSLFGLQSAYTNNQPQQQPGVQSMSLGQFITENKPSMVQAGTNQLDSLSNQPSGIDLSNSEVKKTAILNLSDGTMHVGQLQHTNLDQQALHTLYTLKNTNFMRIAKMLYKTDKKDLMQILSCAGDENKFLNEIGKLLVKNHMDQNGNQFPTESSLWNKLGDTYRKIKQKTGNFVNKIKNQLGDANDYDYYYT